MKNMNNFFQRELELGDLLDELNERARGYALGTEWNFTDICKQTLQDFAVQIKEDGRKFTRTDSKTAKETRIYFKVKE